MKELNTATGTPFTQLAWVFSAPHLPRSLLYNHQQKTGQCDPRTLDALLSNKGKLNPEKCKQIFLFPSLSSFSTQKSRGMEISHREESFWYEGKNANINPLKTKRVCFT
jgi:hypothetical protein